MIIAVVAVRMMQVAVDDVVGMVAVRDGGVTAIGRVNMTSRLFCGAMTGRAGRGIDGGDGDDVLVHMPAMAVVQVAVIQVVGMTVMRDGKMATARAVLMLVRLGMFGVRGTTASDERERNEQEQEFFHSCCLVNETVKTENKVWCGRTSRGFASDLQISPLLVCTSSAELSLRK